MKTAVSIKLDNDVKKGAQKLAKDFGLPFSTLVNIQLKNMIRDGKLVLRNKPELRDDVWREIQKATEDYKKNKNISPEFKTMDEAISWLEL